MARQYVGASRIRQGGFSAHLVSPVAPANIGSAATAQGIASSLSDIAAVEFEPAAFADMLLVPTQDYTPSTAEIIGQNATFTATQIFGGGTSFFTQDLFQYNATAGPGSTGALIEQVNGGISQLQGVSVIQEDITGIGFHQGKIFIRSGDSSAEEAQGVVTLSELDGETAECFIRVGDGRQRRIATFPVADSSYSFFSWWGTIRFTWVNATGERGYRLQVFSGGEQYNKIYGTSDFMTPEPPLTEGAWYHVALVRDADRVYAYFNGNRIMDRFIGELTGNSLTAPPYMGFNLESFGNDTVDFHPGGVHGARFTPRALYTGASFTPPASITDFA